MVSSVFKIRYLIFYVVILMYFFPRENKYYSISISGDLSDLSHAYFFDIDKSREDIKIRHNANIAGNVLYSYNISKKAEYIEVILIFKDGSVVTGGWIRKGNSKKTKITGSFVQ